MKIKEKKPTIADGFKMINSLLTRTTLPQKNEVIELTDGYISYNPMTDTGEETAIVKNRKFFILLGDYRKDLKGCKSITECMVVYKKLVKQGAKISLWSNYEVE